MTLMTAMIIQIAITIIDADKVSCASSEVYTLCFDGCIGGAKTLVVNRDEGFVFFRLCYFLKSATVFLKRVLWA